MLSIKNMTLGFSKLLVRDANLEVKEGLITGIIGPSGSGKSTILDVISLHRYDKQYEYIFNGLDLKTLTSEELNLIKQHDIAYLKQEPLLISTLTCKEHMILEAKLANQEVSRKEIKDILKFVGLNKKGRQYPASLSGGEKQRLTIAMALVKKAKVIILDEITSALDDEQTAKIIEILKKLAHENNKMIVLASHENSVVEACDVLYEIKDESLVLMKNEKIESDEQVYTLPKKTKIGLGMKWRLVLSRMRKRKILFGVSVLLISIIIAINSFTAVGTIRMKNYWKNIINSVPSNELYIKNNTWPKDVDNSLHYVKEMLPFDFDIEDKMKNNENILKYYPIHDFGLSSCLERGGTLKNELKIYSQNQEMKKIELKYPDYDRYLRGDGVIPYTPEQNIDQFVIKKTENKNGVYLKYFFAQDIGLTELTNDMEIEFDLYVNVANDKYRGQVTYENSPKEKGSIVAEMRKIIQKPIRVRLPISGILNKECSLADFYYGTSLFLPADLYESYFQEVGKEYQLKEFETKPIPSAYIIYINKDANREEVKKEILSWDEKIRVCDFIEDYSIFMDTIKKNDLYAGILISVLMIVSIVLVLVYGYFHNQDRIQDLLFFQIRGINKKELRMITIFECIGFACIYFFFATLFNNYLILYRGMVYDLQNTSYVYLVYVAAGIISFILAIMTELSSLISKEGR